DDRAGVSAAVGTAVRSVDRTGAMPVGPVRCRSGRCDVGRAGAMSVGPVRSRVSGGWQNRTMVAHPKFSAVLFDCDGVLVDSESITNGVLHLMLRELGWQLTAEECVARFVGKMLRDEADVIERSEERRVGKEGEHQ